jgi:hypothetical protein
MKMGTPKGVVGIKEGIVFKEWGKDDVAEGKRS